MKETVVEKFDNKLFITLPKKIMALYKLKPVMCAKIIPVKEGFVLKDFSKIVKIRVDLKKIDLKMIRVLMQKEGYGSIDETMNNVVSSFVGIKEQSVYIYPKGFIQSGCELIEEYEKLKKERKELSQKV